jgi:predicted DCC family thiol-disulfide oxidoreductase YuxK
MSKFASVPSSTPPRVGWVLYDGECSFCESWVHLWAKVIGRRGFQLKELQSASADGTLNVPQENLLDDIRILTRGGELFSGADAYLYVTRRIWWAWPFYAIFSLPGFNQVLWWGYRSFARNRYCVSRHCQFPKRT